MNNLDEIREFFKLDRFATLNGMSVAEVGDGYAVCTLELEDRHRNGMGGVMGGVLFTLADFAFAVASNKDVPGVVSLSANISFLNACKTHRLNARATCVKNGKSTCLYDVAVDDGAGNIVAKLTVTGFRVGM